MKTLNNCKINIINEDSFIIKSAPKTDFFIDNHTSNKSANAPFYFDTVDYDFSVIVKIEPDFISTYDAGAVLIYDNDKNWIKAAFELTDLGYSSIVTVVTKNSSDDCNGERFKKKSVWIRVLRKKDYWAVHYSLNRQKWKMVRYFELKLNKEVKVGVTAQSPVGYGCLVKFYYFNIIKNNYEDIRKGE